MRAALDSTVMIYAEGLIDDPRNAMAQDLLLSLPGESLLIPLQAAAETLRWLIRKAKLPPSEAARSVARWTSHYAVQPTDRAVLEGALELVAKHKLQVFDAIILAAAAEARASLLLSEDMHEGFRWRGVTVVNPFAATPSRAMLKLIEGRENKP